MTDDYYPPDSIVKYIRDNEMDADPFYMVVSRSLLERYGIEWDDVEAVHYTPRRGWSRRDWADGFADEKQFLDVDRLAEGDTEYLERFGLMRHYDTGFGGAYWPHLKIWSDDYVVSTGEYDGSLRLRFTARNPEVMTDG